MRRTALLVLLFAPLAACASVGDAVNGPQMSQIGYPAALVPQEQQVISAREPAPEPAGANSLWRVGARAFFADQRAHRVGDIVTVMIEIDDSAQTSNSTNANRTTTNNMGLSNLFGLETSLGQFFPQAFDPENLVGTNSSTATAGTGAVSRAEKVKLTIAAVVTSVLPNGNMVIQGSQEVRTNGEMRQLTVAGIVRSEDISSANTIRHTQIAEARISYGGRGDISAVQRTPAGTGVLTRVAPF